MPYIGAAWNQHRSWGGTDSVSKKGSAWKTLESTKTSHFLVANNSRFSLIPLPAPLDTIHPKLDTLLPRRRWWEGGTSKSCMNDAALLCPWTESVWRAAPCDCVFGSGEPVRKSPASTSRPVVWRKRGVIGHPCRELGLWIGVYGREWKGLWTGAWWRCL